MHHRLQQNANVKEKSLTFIRSLAEIASELSYNSSPLMSNVMR